MTNLVIIESGSKIKAVSKYLSALPGTWHVKSSQGHVRDLPLKHMGLSAPDYVPTYEVSKGSKKIIAELKQAAKQAQTVYLATDPDREGEAIAWHLAQVLNLPEGKYHRIAFNEITQTAIQKAIAAPRKIDMNLFMAQQGRRALDRLVGYKISPVISRLMHHRLSAGRVQSVAVKILVERLRAIENFTPVEHSGELIMVNGHSATWNTKPFVRDNTPYILNQAVAAHVASTTQVRVVDFNEAEKAVKPPPPLTTADMCSSAAKLLGLTVKQTESLAQSLFSKGLITYHRVDSPNSSEYGIELIQSALDAQGLNDHRVDTPNTWPSRAAAQEGHEAIRPTDFSVQPEFESPEHQALYKMIYTRALASQMKPARYHHRNVTFVATDIDIDGVAPEYKAASKALIYPGYLQILNDKNKKQTNDDTAPLPTYTPNEVYHVESGEVKTLKTKPPAHYQEHTLVDKLEKEAIGRPSTIGKIISTILARNYVIRKKKYLVATDLGATVVTLLDDKFDFMAINYPRAMEAELDKIEKGQAQYRQLMAIVDSALEENLSQIGEGVTIEQHHCPECNQVLIKRPAKKKKNTFWWGCSGYPTCTFTAFDDDGKPKKPVH
ncbi:MAG: type I DNA topoisomerase [Paracoccus sp. (in: a-proteobacteria)]